ncbi:MAG: hypothetical protein ACOYUK_04490 [Patescibacteria group bacterium]
MTKTEIKKQLKGVWDSLLGAGKDALIPSAVLFLLDFKAVRQGAEIGKEIAHTGWDWGRTVSSEVKTRIIWWAVLTGVFGLATYVFGGGVPEYVAGGLLFFFAVCLIVLQIYPFTIALAAALAYKWSSDSPTSAPSTMWKLYVHVLFWDCMFLLANLLFKPWLPGHLEWFVVLVLSEAAWFLLSSGTRRAVRLAATVVSGASGIAAFLVLLYMVMSLSDVTKPAAERGRAIVWQFGNGIGDLGKGTGNLIAYAGGKLARSTGTLSALPDPERIIDLNMDGERDSTDADIIARIGDVDRHIIINGRSIVLGDFDGDGDRDYADAVAMKLWLAKQGPGPATMQERFKLAYREPEPPQTPQTQPAIQPQQPDTTIPPPPDTAQQQQTASRMVADGAAQSVMQMASVFQSGIPVGIRQPFPVALTPRSTYNVPLDIFVDSIVSVGGQSMVYLRFQCPRLNPQSSRDGQKLVISGDTRFEYTQQVVYGHYAPVVPISGVEFYNIYWRNFERRDLDVGVWSIEGGQQIDCRLTFRGELPSEVRSVKLCLVVYQSEYWGNIVIPDDRPAT